MKRNITYMLLEEKNCYQLLWGGITEERKRLKMVDDANRRYEIH